MTTRQLFMSGMGGGAMCYVFYKVFKLLGDGATTKILLYPSLIAAAMPRPMAADLPLPLAAFKATVHLLFLSVSTSIKVIIIFAWSNVREVCSSGPTTYFYASYFFNV